MAEQTPDLQAILATLAQFSQQSNSASPVSPGSSAEQLSDPRLTPHSQPTPSNKPQIDPATITVWPDALRCVTKIAEQNKYLSVSIKRMMNDQRNNEMRWYQERQALKQTQANRSTEAAKAHSILKTLNTSFYGSPPEVDPPEVDQKKEMDAFDEKIYSAQEAMENAMLHELKGLGVPFCGTDPKLIVPDEDEENTDASPVCVANDVKLKYSQVITKSQMMHMRRKMIEHLETLYRE
ncbi:hypothetical protein DOTSEDRAFT_177099 [Dothistroma septosporum NZE10]|uniref:Uncharacterized protein n=1 Tax=Dothistroma septosporum (strain NZE10 / CBS 128990) TaxID=675120 RepID=N1PKF1_DOTSN|nr:hypothetical protein DOTSEDRAFT_177099 [Dothistroma septosporum NZE10]